MQTGRTCCLQGIAAGTSMLSSVHHDTGSKTIRRAFACTTAPSFAVLKLTVCIVTTALPGSCIPCSIHPKHGDCSAQARIACMVFPFLDDVEPIADAVAKKAAADAAAALGRGARAAYYAAAAREYVGAEGCAEHVVRPSWRRATLTTCSDEPACTSRDSS